MIKSVLLSVAWALSLWMSPSLIAMGEQPTPPPNTLEYATVTVSGMTCAMCAQGIEKKLRESGRVYDFTVDFDQQRVSVGFDPNNPVTDTMIKDALYYAGYELIQITR